MGRRALGHYFSGIDHITGSPVQAKAEETSLAPGSSIGVAWLLIPGTIVGQQCFLFIIVHSDADHVPGPGLSLGRGARG